MKKVLIVHDSLAGSTTQASGIIAAVFREYGHEVNISTVDSRIHTGGFDAVVAGGYIRYGKPSPAIRDFLHKNTGAIPTAVFFSCLHLTTPEEFEIKNTFIDPGFETESRPLEEMSFSDRQHALSLYDRNLLEVMPNPACSGYIKGRMNFSRLGLIDRISMRAMSLVIKEVGQGDYFKPASAKDLAQSFAGPLGLT